MPVPLSSPQQGDGQEERSSDSDLEEVTSAQLPLHPSPEGFAPTNPCVGAVKHLGWDTQHSPHMLSLFFLFLPQDQGIAKDEEKEDKD